jgi:hypothetical protein
MNPLLKWLTSRVQQGVLRYDGHLNGIDIYTPLSHPWMEETMRDNDPNRPCGCNPNPNPTCEAGDDEED